MKVAQMKKKRRRKNYISNNNRRNASANKTNDPLHSYDTSIPDDFMGTAGEDGFFGEGDPSQNNVDDNKMFMSTHDGTGRSTSGRKSWKEKHRKGKYSKKSQMKKKTETEW